MNSNLKFKVKISFLIVCGLIFLASAFYLGYVYYNESTIDVLNSGTIRYTNENGDSVILTLSRNKGDESFGYVVKNEATNQRYFEFKDKEVIVGDTIYKLDADYIKINDVKSFNLTQLVLRGIAGLFVIFCLILYSTIDWKLIKLIFKR